MKKTRIRHSRKKKIRIQLMGTSGSESYLILLVYAVVCNGEEPGGALQGVGTARLQVQGRQPPVL